MNVINNCDPNTTGIIVVSKSGKTTEPLMLFLTLCEIWKDFDYENRAIAITELSENNDLRILAESKKMSVLEHNSNIGGRFSVFSNVGLIPAHLESIDIDLFIRGAKNVITDIISSKNAEECRLYMDITSMYKVFANGKINEHVLMTYSDFMEDYGKWYVQLVSESLGKTENFGITPIRALGTVDQHSMLQLFLGGPSNKLFTVIIQKNNVETLKISNLFNSKIINHLNGHNILELMSSHQKATIEVLRKKASVRVLEFEEFTMETLGFLMMLSFVEVMTIAKLADINPFDQPAVEESKKLVLKYLEGYCQVNIKEQ
jgi:glucose-6-phosphate isomerase